jgi:hypothetical protein
MNRARVGIIEVQHVRADAVDERSMQNVETLRTTQYRSLRRSRKGRRCGEHAADGLVA